MLYRRFHDNYKEQNVTTYHGMRELSEYKELCKRYDEEEKKLEQCILR